MDKLIELLEVNDRLANECSTAMPLVNDPEVIKAFDFLTRLDSLADKYQFAPKDIVLLLDPSLGVEELPDGSGAQLKPAPKKRKPRPLKNYLNPHTGEVVQTRGANHKVLKQWKALHGAAVVEKWLR
ncbi:DNA binding protein [Pseudomonas sp. RTC3]|uniref:histone-like nucleoid-structuring protein, MvaT/MvaU family n=1 Tax=Pseudomonas sp. 5C2 TaxID=3048588 RepID=UPI002AB4762F|nr:histone-like nucleoid-structuring protein, MvaT/MvaU family [Pseudomonas sp. 5C2]MDY7564714.1 histone-like nucleoid-structuring protein, MvaT/MvaU family [Pseudomonas sp. 5C2]MEB0065070.1 DNA binding protein [Pseudomonas sp. RTC3]MEB0243712.1 DNA binding protein [Pseudomonas sp. 5C2]